MKITNVRTFLVEGIKYNWTLVKIETDAGIHGWGEGTNWPGSPLVEAACRHVGEFITGLDARQIDFIWTKIYRDLNWLGQAGPLLSAISAVDIALWDIKGKALGAPIYELLGGAYRTKIQLYANYWFIEGAHTPEDYARQARETVAQGFTALKFDPFANVNYWYGADLAANGSLTETQKRLALDLVKAVADAVGDDVAIAIETHAFLNAPTAVEMAHRLAELKFNCGELWQFHAHDLAPGRRYRLTLMAGGKAGKPLCQPWDLATFLAPDTRPERVRALFFTCAGGHDALGFLPAALRNRLLRRALSFNPDAAISNGDHVYWDLRSPLTAGMLGASRQARQIAGQPDRAAAILGGDNESFLKRAAAPQITPVYGTDFRSTPVFFIQDDHDYFENDDAYDEIVTFPPCAKPGRVLRCTCGWMSRSNPSNSMDSHWPISRRTK
ncbi:MAG: mandelate racemase/muconate lactonizing enzyme family protein [Blastocatellia bacterium]